MTLRYLMDRRRKTWKKQEEDVSVSFIKDAVITQLENLPFYRLGEIQDIDFGPVTPEGMMKLKIYTNTKGEKSKTKKD